MIHVLCTCLPIVLIILTGMICRKYDVFSDEGVQTLKKVVLCITLPPLMFSAFAEIEYSFNNIILIAIMFSVCVVALLLGRALRVLFGVESRFMPYVTTTFELGMLGYALYAMLYPGESLGYLASIDIGLTLFANTVYRFQLNRESKTAHRNGGEIVRNIFRSPIVIGIIAGILFGATGLYKALKLSGAADVLDACTDFFGAPTAAIVLLTIGCDLNLSNVPWKAVMKTVAARLIIMAAMRFGVGMLLNALHIGEYLHAMNIVFILPTAFILPVFADDHNESNYIASCLSVYTVLMVLLFMLLVIFS